MSKMNNSEDQKTSLPLPPFDDLSELGYRGRGRPKLPEDQRRRQKLIVALSDDEMRVVMHRAADAHNGPKRLQDWARSVLASTADQDTFRDQIIEIIDELEDVESSDDLILGFDKIKALCKK